MIKLLLTLLTIILAQPALAMDRTYKQRKKNSSKKNRILDGKLRQALEREDTQAVATLLANGARANSQHDGKTPLMRAKKNITICRLLLEYGADANAQDNYGKSTLMRAAYSPTDDLCKLLIEYGAEVNAQDQTGKTALMHACQYYCGNVATRRCLLAHGTDLYPKDEYGRTALQISMQWENESTVIITDSQFYFYCTAKQLREAQHRTRLRIWLMKRTCPQLPRDVLELLLKKYDANTWQDACCTPLRLHTIKYDRITRMPLPVLRTLIKHKALDREKAIMILTTHKMDQLTPLMLEAITPRHPMIPSIRNPALQAMLDPSKLEEHFGEVIRENIRAELSPENPGLLASCTIQ